MITLIRKVGCYLRPIATCNSSMTPLESELLQHLGIIYLNNVEELSILVFFYGTSFSLMVYGPSTSSTTGIFVVLFSTSLLIVRATT